MATPVAEEVHSVHSRLNQERLLPVLQKVAWSALAPLDTDGASSSFPTSGEISDCISEPRIANGGFMDDTGALHAEITAFARQFRADVASAVEALEGRLQEKCSSLKFKFEQDVSSLQVVTERQQAALEDLGTQASRVSGLEQRVKELCVLLNEQRSFQEERSIDLHRVVVGLGSRLNEQESMFQEVLVSNAGTPVNKIWSSVPVPPIRSPRVPFLPLDGQWSQETPRAVEALTTANQQVLPFAARSVNNATRDMVVAEGSAIVAAIMTKTSPPSTAKETTVNSSQERLFPVLSSPRLPNAKVSTFDSVPTGSGAVTAPAGREISPRRFATPRTGFLSPTAPPMSIALRDISPTPLRVATMVNESRFGATTRGTDAATIASQARSPVRLRPEANAVLTPRAGVSTSELPLTSERSGTVSATGDLSPTFPRWTNAAEPRFGAATSEMGAMPQAPRNMSPVRLRSEALAAVAPRGILSPGSSGGDLIRSMTPFADAIFGTTARDTGAETVSRGSSPLRARPEVIPPVIGVPKPQFQGRSIERSPVVPHQSVLTPRSVEISRRQKTCC